MAVNQLKKKQSGNNCKSECVESAKRANGSADDCTNICAFISSGVASIRGGDGDGGGRGRSLVMADFIDGLRAITRSLSKYCTKAMLL